MWPKQIGEIAMRSEVGRTGAPNTPRLGHQKLDAAGSVAWADPGRGEVVACKRPGAFTGRWRVSGVFFD